MGSEPIEADPIGSLRVPPAAQWLGGLGLLPFVALGLVAVLGDGATADRARFALCAYAAVIVSFLGGVHWGIAVMTPRLEATLRRRLVYSVVPSVFGWSALLLPAVTGLGLLSAAFVAMLWFDIIAARAGHAPAWYPRLRIPLSCIVVGTLLLVAVRAAGNP